MIVSEYNVITGQRISLVDVSDVEPSTVRNLVEFELIPEPEYYTNKDCFENDGAYAEDSNDD